MKTLMTFALIVLAPIVTRADDKGPIGRYQLLYGVTDQKTSTGSYEKKRVWKTDTVTGQVWECAVTSEGGEVFYPVTTKEP
jgi:hypothetical protein